MHNTLKFDIANIGLSQPKMFAVKLNNQIVYSKTTILSQEVISLDFDNSPGEHLLELILLSSVGDPCSIAVGHFKLNQYDLVDHRMYSYFAADGGFRGILEGTKKISFKISTPIVDWLRHTRVC